VRGIWRLLSRPGLINVDFADLCSVTRGRHAESCLVTAEAQGENRSREVMEKILAHPLIEGGQVLTESAGVLVCIAGGKGLTMAEVNRIMEQINRMLEEKEQRLKERRITSQGAASSMVRGKISRSGFVLFAIPR